MRLAGGDPAPVRDRERVVVVVERGGERRGAAERWWRHQTGCAIQVREGVAWVLRFAPGVDADDCASDLARVRDRGHGLLSNPHAQDARVSGADVALPCLTAPRRARRRAASEPS